jgi:hypothetical protein
MVSGAILTTPKCAADPASVEGAAGEELGVAVGAALEASVAEAAGLVAFFAASALESFCCVGFSLASFGGSAFVAGAGLDLSGLAEGACGSAAPANALSNPNVTPKPNERSAR